MKNKILTVLNVVSFISSLGSGIVEFQRAEDAKTSKERFKNYAFGLIHFVIAIINARYIADQLLKPEPEEIPEGSMEDVSEKEFIDKEIEAEV